MKYLKIKDSKTVDDTGRTIKLRGVNIGGWLSMENWITGFPGYESTFKCSVSSVLGKDKATFYFEKFLDYFLSEDDFRFMNSLGINLVRISINYRNFVDNRLSRTYRKIGFNYFDRAIEQAKRNNIYVIINLHAAPGWQNPRWHSDSTYRANLLWYSEDAQLKTIDIWEEMAKRYKDEPAVCGYGIINEPDAPNQQALISFYERVISRIRKHDPQHIIVPMANRYGQDPTGLEMLDDNNLLFEVHYYPLAGIVDTVYPGEVPILNGSEKLYYDENFLEKEFLSKAKPLIDKGKAIYAGEFGSTFHNTSNDQYRLKVNEDLFKIFDKYDAAWTMWTYKDIGLQSLVYVPPNSEYIKKFSDLLKLKENLGADDWGSKLPFIKNLSSHFMDSLKTELSKYSHSYVENVMNIEGEILSDVHRFPYTYSEVVTTTLRFLISHYLSHEFAERFKGMSYDELDKIARSFNFDNCVKREPLADLFSKFCIG